MRKVGIASIIAGALAIGVAIAMRVSRDEAPCGARFVRVGPRCMPEYAAKSGSRACAAPPRSVVRVPKTSVVIGPSDWEAEGRVQSRTVEAGPFDIDAHEVAVGDLPSDVLAVDGCQAASRISLAEARAFCKGRGGRLPTEDEWIVAAAGDRPRRYPWGDTGAVCRRAAWGLVRGPCGEGATGPDTVGSHADGATPLGIQDLAGNVAEWVEVGGCDGPVGGECIGVVRGGSYETDLATDLRTWVRREVSWASKVSTIGFRCAYDANVK